MRPFQAASTFSSRPGLTRFSRSAKSFWRKTSILCQSSSGEVPNSTATASRGLGTLRMFLPSKLPRSVTSQKRIASLALRIGILGGVEAALRSEHVAGDVVQRLLGNPTVESVARRLVSLQVQVSE